MENPACSLIQGLSRFDRCPIARFSLGRKSVEVPLLADSVGFHVRAREGSLSSELLWVDEEDAMRSLNVGPGELLFQVERDLRVDWRMPVELREGFGAEVRLHLSIRFTESSRSFLRTLEICDEAISEEAIWQTLLGRLAGVLDKCCSEAVRTAFLRWSYEEANWDRDTLRRLISDALLGRYEKDIGLQVGPEAVGVVDVRCPEGDRAKRDRLAHQEKLAKDKDQGALALERERIAAALTMERVKGELALVEKEKAMAALHASKQESKLREKLLLAETRLVEQGADGIETLNASLQKRLANLESYLEAASMAMRRFEKRQEQAEGRVLAVAEAMERMREESLNRTFEKDVPIELEWYSYGMLREGVDIREEKYKRARSRIERLDLLRSGQPFQVEIRARNRGYFYVLGYGRVGRGNSDCASCRWYELVGEGRYPELYESSINLIQAGDTILLPSAFESPNPADDYWFLDTLCGQELFVGLFSEDAIDLKNIVNTLNERGGRPSEKALCELERLLDSSFPRVVLSDPIQIVHA